MCQAFTHQCGPARIQVARESRHELRILERMESEKRGAGLFWEVGRRSEGNRQHANLVEDVLLVPGFA